jgi:hypothetical protein
MEKIIERYVEGCKLIRHGINRCDCPFSALSEESLLSSRGCAGFSMDQAVSTLG